MGGDPVQPTPRYVCDVIEIKATMIHHQLDHTCGSSEQVTVTFDPEDGELTVLEKNLSFSVTAETIVQVDETCHLLIISVMDENGERIPLYFQMSTERTEMGDFKLQVTAYALERALRLLTAPAKPGDASAEPTDGQAPPKPIDGQAPPKPIDASASAEAVDASASAEPIDVQAA